MSLGEYAIGTSVAVSDIEKCRNYYEQQLGLEIQQAFGDQMSHYVCGNGTSLTIYSSPDHAGKATGTLAGWNVDDLDVEMAELRSRGVEFMSYDGETGPETDENDVFNHGSMRAAWLQDPEGNTYAINEGSM